MNPIALVLAFARRLRFPQLFLLVAALFLADLIVPDAIPFIDEILLGLATLLFGSWKQSRESLDDGERTARSRARSAPR